MDAVKHVGNGKVGHKGPDNVPRSPQRLCLFTDSGIRNLSAEKVGDRGTAHLKGGAVSKLPRSVAYVQDVITHVVIK